MCLSRISEGGSYAAERLMRDERRCPDRFDANTIFTLCRNCLLRVIHSFVVS